MIYPQVRVILFNGDIKANKFQLIIKKMIPSFQKINWMIIWWIFFEKVFFKGKIPMMNIIMTETLWKM